MSKQADAIVSAISKSSTGKLVHRTTRAVTRRTTSTATLVDIEDALVRSTTPLKRKARASVNRSAKRSKNATTNCTPPARWLQTYNTMKAQRERLPAAPVDTMGCAHLYAPTASPQDRRFQILVSLMLSSQTKDTVTAIAMKNLHTSLPGGLCVDSILQTDEQHLNELIKTVGFHNTKAKNILRVARILVDKFDSDVPRTVAELTSLPGIGPKMAYLALLSAWKIVDGIGVDTHVHRITNLWGWHSTSKPEETRASLEAWLPREYWGEINELLVGFGQTVCLGRGRGCEKCDVGAQGLCPGMNPVARAAAKKQKQENIKIEAKTVVQSDEPDEKVKEQAWIKVETVDE